MEHIYFFTNDLTIGFIARMLDLSFRSIMLKLDFRNMGVVDYTGLLNSWIIHE